MLKKELIEVIDSHPILPNELREAILRLIREYRVSHPKLWDQVVKMFQRD